MPHQKFEGERTLMRIHIGESDKWHGKPLHEAIVEMLRKEGFSGATVLRGVAGYGGSSVYHTDKILRLSQDLPIVLEVIESAERIEQILPRLDEMVDGGQGIGRRRPLEEDEWLSAFALVHALLEDIVVLPKLQDALFQLLEVEHVPESYEKMPCFSRQKRLIG